MKPTKWLMKKVKPSILVENFYNMNTANKATICEWGVGLSGLEIFTIYGSAFGGPAGAIAEAVTEVAWIPVSAACN